MSLESRHGWYDLYLSLGAWPDRIIDARRSGNRERDELAFFLSFFVQCYHLRDWAKEQPLPRVDELDALWNSYDCMRLCRDISNRYKHLTLSKQKPSLDADWTIWVDYDRRDLAWTITAGGQSWVLWDLMIECWEFWEAACAAFDWDGDPTIYRPD